MVEEGGFLYDADDYNDELPWWAVGLASIGGLVAIGGLLYVGIRAYRAASPYRALSEAIP